MNTLQKYNLIKNEYESTFHKCSAILEQNGLGDNIALVHELHGLMLCITDYCAFSFEGGKLIVETLVESLFSARLRQRVGSRILFYGGVILGDSIHAHCFMGSDRSQLDKPLDRCILAFCDCCLYPPYIADYNCPTPRLDFTEVTAKTFTLYFPILKEMLEFCDHTLGTLKR